MLNNNKKKLTSLLLASSIALSTSVAPLGAVNSNNIGEDKSVCEETNSVSTPQPTKTQTPKPTSTPSQSNTPKPTNTPKPIKTQSPTKKPVATSKPTQKTVQATSKPITYKDGWLLENSNIRKLPNLNASKYTVLPKGTKVKYADYSNDWVIIKYQNSTAYVYKKLISQKEVKKEVLKKKVSISSTSSSSYTTYNAPQSKDMKSFMPYKTITARNSDQYKLQKKAYNGNYGVRQVNGRYCIALGSYYTTQIGTHIDLILKNGTVIPCILADCKKNKDTDSTNRVHSSDGSIAEFVVVSISALSKKVINKGSLSGACPEWDSPVSQIRIYNYVENF